MKFLNEKILKIFSGKTCVMRIDINSDPKSDEGLFRLHAVLPTIIGLRMSGVRVVLISHRGRPLGEDQKCTLKPFVKVIEREVGEKVRFIPLTNFEEIADTIEAGKENIFLLENIRFLKGEEMNDASLGKQLAALGSFYINDAFAVSHRESASTCAITKYIPSYAGPLMKREIGSLRTAMKPLHPFVLMIGGAKISDKLPLIEKFWKSADAVIVGGGAANTLLAAQGIPMGNSLYDASLIPRVQKYANAAQVITPSDTRDRKNEILDIGPKTEKEFSIFLKGANTVVWNGPMGMFEKKGFELGTRAMWSTLIKRAKLDKNVHIYVGGGETITSLRTMGLLPTKLPKNIFLSTGGGAMLEFLSGKKLPGIDALK